MRPSARIQAAIEVIDRIVGHHQPAATALADWGKTHRFAGSGDRAAIGNLVYDALRHRALSAFHLRGDCGRSLVIGALHAARGLDVEAIAALCDGAKHAPAPLSGDERTRLRDGIHAGAADWQRANVPAWTVPLFHRVFGDAMVAQGEALASRAPVDLRVNTLRASREDVLGALAHVGATAVGIVATAVRIPPPTGDGRTPNVEAEVAHGRGWYEVQDAGSQIAAALAAPRPGDAVLDLCAGAGGKTLALAAAMANAGTIVAYDSDKARLRPIFERLTRAGASIVEVLSAGDTAALDARAGRFDLVLVDAPCTGSGTWRRKPDAKWRLKPPVLEARLKDQRAVLERAVRMVKPGGRIVYVTCSLFAEENTDQVAAFLAAHRNFEVQPWREAWSKGGGSNGIGTAPPASSADGRDDTLLLTPATHATDGFFIAVLHRSA